MPSWWERLRGRSEPEPQAGQYTLDELHYVLTQSGTYPLFGQTLVGNRVQIAPDFLGVVRGAYKANPIVFSCVDNRQALFSEATFKFQRMRNGVPGDLFGSGALRPLEEPWAGGTTGDLLALAEVWVSMAGNFFAARRPGDRIAPLRPDWTAIVLGTEEESADPEDIYSLDAEVAGYMHQPGGLGSGVEPLFLLPEEVAHFMPRPDPEARWRGMSWLTPVLNEVEADRQMTEHKSKYLEAGATPNLAVVLPVETMEMFEKWVEKYKGAREGAAGNPYKTLFLAAGADPKPLGANLEQVDFANVQSGGEVRIAVAAGVPPAVLSISKGLEGSALNAGNFEAAWRQFANQTIRPLWRNFASSMSRIIDVPDDARLWYFDSDVPALAEDSKKRADVQRIQASTINTLITAGYEPESVVAAVESDDLSLLQHTGRISVQLFEPGQGPNPNGNGDGDEAAARRALKETAKT